MLCHIVGTGVSLHKQSPRHVQVYDTQMKPPQDIPQFKTPGWRVLVLGGFFSTADVNHYLCKVNSFRAQKNQTGHCRKLLCWINPFHAITAPHPPSPCKATILYVATAIWQWHPSREIIAYILRFLSTSILKPCCQKTNAMFNQLAKLSYKKLLIIADIAATRTV